MKKEEIYINLQGKTKEELTDLWEFLNSNGEIVPNTKDYFIDTHLKYNNTFIALSGNNEWIWWGGYNKKEITIQQLKEIIKPMGTFTPIAMKCTQEQFDAVKPKLKHLKTMHIDSFVTCAYLINNFSDTSFFISNVSELDKKSHNRKIHETWNEEIFLKACGIEFEPKFKKGDSIIITDFEVLDMSSDFSLNKPYKIKDIGTSDVIWLVDDAGDNHGITLYSAIKMKVELCTETIQEQLQKAQSEVERLQSLIEEENKPKLGDWIYDTKRVSFYKKITQGVYSEQRKITNPELIKLLENECSTKN